jgi:nucleoside 2-deoxyribosyltransferase
MPIVTKEGYMQTCIICDSQPKEIINMPEHQVKKIICPLCVTYIISDEALADKIIDDISKEDRILFSGYIRENADRGIILRLLSSDILQIPEKVAYYKRLAVKDKLDMLISYFATHSKHIGQEFNLDYSTDFNIFFCKDPVEFKTLLHYLKDIGYINGMIARNCMNTTALTVSGWQEYERIKELNIHSKKVFVAMSFKDSTLKDLFKDAISPACGECGLNAIRIDSIEHNEKICDEIISEIKTSRLLIADFTGQSQNVYFEAGFALGLGIKVIWICKDSEKDSLHFDTRQYNHIFWKDAEDLHIQLVNRIKATVL